MFIHTCLNAYMYRSGEPEISTITTYTNWLITGVAQRITKIL